MKLVPRIAATGSMAIFALAAAFADAQPRKPPGTLLEKVQASERLKIRVVNGRLFASGQPANIDDKTSAFSSRKERLRLTSLGDGFTLDYESTAGDERTVVRISEGRDFTIRRVVAGKTPAPPIELNQAADSPLVLTFGDGDQKTVRRGRTLWHLLLGEIEEPQRRLASLLDELFPLQRFSDRTTELADELFRLASAGRVPDRSRWDQLVAQLDDDRYTRREAADRELRGAGPTALSFLQQFDAAQLSPEQQFRIERIVDRLSREVSEDLPGRIASWLQQDPTIWLVLMGHSSIQARQKAADYLSKLLGEPIAFDPSAPPETRARQLAALRSRFK